MLLLLFGRGSLTVLINLEIYKPILEYLLHLYNLLTDIMSTLPEPPAQLKAIQAHMRIAQDIDRVDPIVSYWVRLYCTETALKIDKDSPECKTFLVSLISWLETFKKERKDNEAVTNQTVGQAHVENFVVALFNKADTLDREGTANKNTVRMFYMSAILFEAMAVFGELTEEISKRAKYAKFKAAYIQKCLKTGQIPKPGPIEGNDLEGDANPAAGTDASNASSTDPAPNQEVKMPPSMPKPSGGFDIPEVPPNDPTEPNPPKPDPFILTPSKPPTLPSSNPQGTSTTPKYPPASSSTTSTTPRQEGGATITSTRFCATNGAPLRPEDILEGQKYCKFANSALQYDDIPTAVANLEKALKLLKMGERTA